MTEKLVMGVAEAQAFGLIDEHMSRGEYQEAFHLAHTWAERDCSWAENCIASLYHAGLGVTLDLARAFQFYGKAAQHGSAAAWYHMGVLFEAGGKDFKTDLELSKSCYKRAEELGYFPCKPLRFEIGGD